MDLGLVRALPNVDNVYMSTEVVSIRLPAELKSRLDTLAEATGRSAAFYVKAALEDRLDDLEWAYGIAANAENLRAGRRPARPIDSLISDLGFTRDELASADGEAE
jgi:RHH-type rel operon transcriptional repressor/antitoxin RelB